MARTPRRRRLRAPRSRNAAAALSAAGPPTSVTASWHGLLERQRAAREGYCTAVRDDLALPPGHGARRPLPPAHQG
ncbi:hypothetical protein [Streptomyces sp. S.PNR 29]|uniref:hypothetical protein n=1 Tax=Streptomyces sp. S.PNR 29 TaxID=2973805 RepID=UPI0025AFEEDF|nr:hypothetical protein [Streptomyces sp. S.PNR 29]MDN0197803.1 hypothetical protein [Streptomyces sp. S.PNR 29]